VIRLPIPVNTILVVLVLLKAGGIATVDESFRVFPSVANYHIKK